MSEIKLYIEFHWGQRRPNINLLINDQTVDPTSIAINRLNQYQENAIITYQSQLLKYNRLEIVMTDKQDQDLLQVDGKYIDHWVKIRELEVDNIKFETCLYNACTYQHSMSDEWVQQQFQNGHVIEKEYPHGTDIRLNGTWTINFTTPVWQWCVERFNK